jgi:UDPglucose 6-dehydrogenase
MASLMHAPVMIDGRNFLDRKALEQAGFRYVGVGRG